MPPKLIILGSASAVPDLQHENTHMFIKTDGRHVLIDAPGNPITRLQSAGLDPLGVTDLILTHFHPDHAAGVPLLLMVSWLLGRKESLHIYGLSSTLERVEALMDAYDWASWPNMFPCVFHYLPAQEMVPVLESDVLHVYASPVKHLVPTIGLRVEFIDTGRVLAYSSDTQPCEAVIGLARGVDVLIHEASGATLGHTSASQAGDIAIEAGVHTLYLIHYPTQETRRLIDQAQETFQGEVCLAEDYLEIPF